MASPISNWTKEREANLAKLWAEGSSCRQIAEALGDTTRNSVIGKIHRLGLSKPVVKKPFTKKKREKRRAKRSSASHDQIIHRIVRANGNSNSNQMRRMETIQREQYKLRCVEIECLTTFEDLTGCRYPVGDGPFLFCNGPRMEGKSYCTPHFHLTNVPPLPFKDRAPLREVA